MSRKTGYLASLDNIPPLIFRFQYNPEILQEKKSYKYKEANSFGQWGFDQTSAASGFLPTLGGLLKDVKEIGSLLVATKPLEAETGDQRQFSIDFVLDADNPGPLDGERHYVDFKDSSRGSILPDLAVLRSFVNPSLDLIDWIKIIAAREPFCWTKPPQCSLVYASLNITCVMTDLNIKMTSFRDSGDPIRAEVSVTLKEQTFSVSPVIDFFERHVYVGASYVRQGFGTDVLAVTPIVSMFV